MTDRPILFSGPMVQAMLCGRKTQTRRMLRPAFGRNRPILNLAEHGGGDGYSGRFDDPASWGYPFAEDGADMALASWPETWGYQKGDRLWIREAWRCNGWASDVATIFYRASAGDGYTAMCEQYPVAGRTPLRVTGTWRPGIHLPRWASRLTLDVTDVKVERLQAISEADAIAEGADPIVDHGAGSTPYLHRIGFEHLWGRINGETAWLENPFVVAITFKVIKANIDAPEALAA